MNPTNPFRREGGLAGFTAGILLPAGHILNLGGHPDYGTVAGGSLILAAHVLLVFALVGIHAGQAGRSGLPGRLGLVLSVIGTTLVPAIVLTEISGAAGVPVEELFATPFAGSASLLGAFAFFFGMILFGVAVMRAGVFPGWAGLLLVAGMVVFGAGSFAGGAGPIVSIAGAALTGAGFIRLSWALLGLT